MSDKLKVVVSVRTDKIGSECERSFSIDRNEWKDMSVEEREEICREEMWKMIEWNYEAEDE